MVSIIWVLLLKNKDRFDSFGGMWYCNGEESSVFIHAQEENYYEKKKCKDNSKVNRGNC